MVSEPESPTETPGVNNELQSQTEDDNDIIFASTAPPQIRILQRGLDESRAATGNNNEGARGINATGATHNNLNIDLGATDNGTLNFGATENNENNLNVINISDNESRETIITNPIYAEREREKLAFRLDRLNDKRCRYESHENFLKKCLSNNLVPNGLKVFIEPSIGNVNKTFLPLWHSKLDEFSRTLTGEVIKSCKTEIAKTKNEINVVNKQLSDLVTNGGYPEIIKTTANNAKSHTNELGQ